MALRLPLLAALWASASAFSIVNQQQRWYSTSSRLFASIETTKALGKPGTAEMDVPWEDLGFEFRPTNSNVRMTYKDGEWGEMELVKVRNGCSLGFLARICTLGTHDDVSFSFIRHLPSLPTG